MNSQKNKKICTKCNEEKEFSCYNKFARSKDGYKNICKKCQSIYNKSRYERANKGPSTQDLLEFTVEKMKLHLNDYSELKKLHDQMAQLLRDLEIENKVSDTNSFTIKNIEEHTSSSKEKFKADITLKLLNIGVLVNGNDIHVVKKEKEYIVQLDNVNITVEQKTLLSQL